LGFDINHTNERNLQALFDSIGAPVPVPVTPAGCLATFTYKRTVHHGQDWMRWVDALLNQGAIQLGKIDFSLKLPSIGTLVQRAVTAQIGEVDFAHGNQNRREQGH
jgi:hypothetical protein